MPIYSWKGMDRNGTSVRGSLLALSHQELQEQLLERGVALLDYSKGSDRLFNFSRFFRFKVGSGQLYSFFDQLALLTESGIELSESLNILANQMTDRGFGCVLRQIVQDICEGKSFNSAIRLHPQTFPDFVVQMISVGEKTGKLGVVLGQLRDFFKRKFVLRQKVKKAALMPLITLTVSLLLVWGILVFVMPHFESMYQALGCQLPPLTQKVLWVSGFLQSFSGILIVFGTVPIFWGARRLFARSFFRNGLEVLLLKIPLVSSLMIYTNLSMFISTIYLFLISGLPLDQALQHSESFVRNASFKMQVGSLHTALLRGKSLSEAMQANNKPFFDEQIVSLVRVGEKTGDLAHVMKRAGFLYQRKLDDLLHFFTTLASPILVLLVGLVIGSLMVVIYLPLFNMGNIFHF